MPRIIFEIKLIIITNGRKIFNIGYSNHDIGYAILSAYSAAKVLGVTSAKIKITIVRTTTDIATPASPYNLIAISVLIADANMFTKLFINKMRPSVLSGLLIR